MNSVWVRLRKRGKQRPQAWSAGVGIVISGGFWAAVKLGGIELIKTLGWPVTVLAIRHRPLSKLSSARLGLLWPSSMSRTYSGGRRTGRPLWKRLFAALLTNAGWPISQNARAGLRERTKPLHSFTLIVATAIVTLTGCSNPAYQLSARADNNGGDIVRLSIEPGGLGFAAGPAYSRYEILHDILSRYGLTNTVLPGTPGSPPRYDFSDVHLDVDCDEGVKTTTIVTTDPEPPLQPGVKGTITTTTTTNPPQLKYPDQCVRLG